LQRRQIVLQRRLVQEKAETENKKAIFLALNTKIREIKDRQAEAKREKEEKERALRNAAQVRGEE